MKKVKNQSSDLALWSLRIGLAFVFLYASISGLQHPLQWVGYIPNFMVKIAAATSWLKLFSIVELLLASWLIIGRYLRYAAWLSALLLAGIVLTNLSQLIITFRDVGLCLMAVALALLSE